MGCAMAGRPSVCRGAFQWAVRRGWCIRGSGRVRTGSMHDPGRAALHPDLPSSPATRRFQPCSAFGGPSVRPVTGSAPAATCRRPSTKVGPSFRRFVPWRDVPEPGFAVARGDEPSRIEASVARRFPMTFPGQRRRIAELHQHSGIQCWRGRAAHPINEPAEGARAARERGVRGGTARDRAADGAGLGGRGAGRIVLGGPR